MSNNTSSHVRLRTTHRRIKERDSHSILVDPAKSGEDAALQGAIDGTVLPGDILPGTVDGGAIIPGTLPDSGSGEPGPPGRDGEDSDLWPIPGLQGPTGPAGPAGADGAPGTGGSGSGIGAPGLDGEDGESWPIPGLKGETGATGATGPAGADGSGGGGIGPPGMDGEEFEPWPMPGPVGPAGPSGVTGFIGAKAKTNGTVNISTATFTRPALAAEDWDTDSFHDLVTNNERITIPAGLGGKYAVSVNGQWDNTVANAKVRYLYVRKNGSSTDIMVKDISFTNGGFPMSQSASGVLNLVPGDYLDIECYQDEGSTRTLQATLSIVKLDSGKVGAGIGAAAYNSGNQTVTAATETTALFDSEFFDTDGFHDTATNTGRMTIPAGLGGKYLVLGSLYCPTTPANTYVQIRKNGATYYGLAQDTNSTNHNALNIQVVLDLVAGDYVEMRGYRSSGTTFGTGYTTLSIMRLDSGSSAYTGPRWGSGTAFPSGPATNDRFTRTDLGMDFYYDGTRWLSIQLFVQQLVVRLTLVGENTGDVSATLSATGSKTRALTPHLQGGSGIWLVNHRTVFNVFAGGTALGASHKWVGTCIGYDSTPTSTGTIATVNIDSGTSNIFREVDVAIGAAQAAGTLFYQTTWTKTGTPGIIALGEQFTYRIIAT